MESHAGPEKSSMSQEQAISEEHQQRDRSSTQDLPKYAGKSIITLALPSLHKTTSSNLFTVFFDSVHLLSVKISR